ncbi:acyl-ACP--UDP-N-acetylglucosamine O-acyltransferase [Streptomyces sp. NPDC048484]|uniref:acyl-ACP--UDP-N-acetylglucosamine O-acyltransferase n=1 Tax=Streptomyces sp. NPDC048484 TaxID=3155146 RepID=UPI00343D4FF6
MWQDTQHSGDRDAHIHPSALVSPGAELGAGAQVGPFAVVEEGAELGDGVCVQAHAVVHGSATLGAGVVVGVHAVVGGDPQDLRFDARTATRAVVGAGTVLREGATVHRSTGEEPTRIGSDCLLMGNTHIGHDCVLGDGVVVSQLTGLGGHVRVGDHAVIGGGSGVVQWVRIGRLAMVGAKTKVERDVLPFTVVDGVPAQHRGLNHVGMRRHGISAAAQIALRRYFTALQSGMPDDGVCAEELTLQVEEFLAAPSGRGITPVTPRPRPARRNS